MHKIIATYLVFEFHLLRSKQCHTFTEALTYVMQDRPGMQNKHKRLSCIDNVNSNVKPSA